MRGKEESIEGRREESCETVRQRFLVPRTQPEQPEVLPINSQRASVLVISLGPTMGWAPLEASAAPTKSVAMRARAKRDFMVFRKEGSSFWKRKLTRTQRPGKRFADEGEGVSGQKEDDF